MINFFTSENGTVTRRAGLSFSWLAIALVAVTILSAAPAQADCVPYQQCYGIFCGQCKYLDCSMYAGCGGLWWGHQYCNTVASGCIDVGWSCTEYPNCI